MEDDDEFGDLYTDVLRPFTSSSSSAAPPLQQSSSAHQYTHRPIDLNDVDDEEYTPYGAPNSNQTQAFSAATDRVVNNSDSQKEIGDDIAVGSTVSESADAKLGNKALEDVKHAGGPSDNNSVRTQQSGGDEDMVEKEVNFDIEEAVNAIDDVGSELVIPGLSSDLPVGDSGRDAVDDDWDRDSEDDLQIVLNDSDHGPMAIERGGDDEDDDEDEDAFVIVAGGDPNQPIEVQDWGDDAAQLADGERKEMSEAGKSGASMVVPPKIGYSSHGYHPFHSQFKYVRPGAAPMPGAATSGPGVVPGQVRPLINMGPMAGRGRGEWRSPGMNNATQMQKTFHSGFGMPVRGAGRGFGGGLEFTLPSHKTIFEVDIDSFEDKPWKYPGIDVSDFFNFGFNEESWKCYCKQLEQLRLESTMQNKISVKESARTEQEYDPDLPPELAAATGNRDVPAENTNPGKMDAAQSDLVKKPTFVRPPLPTGRAIQVEGGYGERFPSIDTRPPRIRDSDAIIEIIPQGSLDDDTSVGNDGSDKSDKDSPREDSQGGNLTGGVEKMDSEYSESVPQAYSGQKRESDETQTSLPNSVRNEIPDRNGILPEPPEASVVSAGSMEQSCESEGNFVSEFEERKIHGRVSDMSPPVTPRQNTKDKRYLDDRPEGLVERMYGKCSPVLSSPVCKSSFKQRDADHDELVLADGTSGMENVGMASNGMNAKENEDAKKKELTSQVEQPIAREPNEGEDSKATSSDSSRARSVSSKDYQRLHDGVEEEVMRGCSPHMKGIKRYLHVKEQGFQRKYHDGRPELERSRVIAKGKDGSYLHRESDSSSVPHLHIKSDGLVRQKERSNADEMWQHRDDDSYSRRFRNEESRKREHGDEMGSRHRGKVRETDRSDKGELLYSGKHLDDGSYRIYHDKDGGGWHKDRDDNISGRYEHMGDYHRNRRKDEEYLRRDRIRKGEIFHGPRENTSRRKQEREEVLDQRKSGEQQQRFRENLDDHSVRHKDGDWLQKERMDRHSEREWQRLKQEENIFKRKKEDRRGHSRRGCGAEDKAWFGHGRTEDENKGSHKEYHYKETVHHEESSKRRDRTNKESSHEGGSEDVRAHGKQVSNEERKLRHESSSPQNSQTVSISNEQKVHEEKNKDNYKRNKGSKGGSISAPAKRSQDHSIHSNEMGTKCYIEQGIGEQEVLGQNPFSKRQREEASDGEQQDSRRGRSKLERWTSNEERDFSIKNKSISTLKFKEIDQNNGESLESSKPLGELPKPHENVDTLRSLAGEKDAADQEIKDDETKPLDDKNQDTIEKLKKRSERFKPLPIPSEKDAVVTINLEPESLPSANNETTVNSEIKPERPARKRRWISN